MPCNVELVVAVSLDEIAHQVHAVLEREHPSPMRYWLSQALITVMARHQKVEMLSLRPLLRFRASEPPPRKSCGGPFPGCTRPAQVVVDCASRQTLALSALS